MRTAIHTKNITLTALSIAMSSLLLTACSKAEKSASVAETASPIIVPRAMPAPARIKVTPLPLGYHDLEENSASYMSANVNSGVYAPSLSRFDNIVAPQPQNTENYQDKKSNPIHQTANDAIATFSIDTDTGSYANTRRFLNDGKLPPTDAVRVEELINYFNYDFSRVKAPNTATNNAPFLVDTETVASPWRPTSQIVKVAIKANDPTAHSYTKNNNLPPANLVFLVDVSGSMGESNKLELAKSSLKMLTKQLRAQDTISLVTYAGNTEIALPATSGSEKDKILAAIEKLNSSGSTNGEAAIKLAYQQARANFKKDGINRILMLTDGDFNVGVSDVDEMLDIIRRERDSGVSLSTFGFGEGNLNDYMMEQVADNGNGNYSYIDSLSEAKKALIDEMSSTFNTVAKDVKVQVEFNPTTVKEWRLIGYENRILATEDFNNDKIDAGDLGAGKSVVALFEVTPVGQKGWVDDSRYQAVKANAGKSNELGFLKIRYKAPTGTTSQLLEVPISKQTTTPSNELQFALAVAGFGEKLSQSPYIGNWQFANSKQLAQANLGTDTQGIRHEFMKLVDLAGTLQPTGK